MGVVIRDRSDGPPLLAGEGRGGASARTIIRASPTYSAHSRENRHFRPAR